ncbi:WD repeat-containing and planar cell polarity effector protein fritz isoform X2 [Condylostylus longicornis]|uniref:WD repeat-containing and planar cell polarity effector protein fritz isoform X2 n=1 Tax=Condylostylus longicornis TaxID=2530218 RepID=UPI00244E42A0|nr:WD repeat-containing and planar cell polarity effector protein fritz isoform X2 [Condylostylus longicornis]
MLTLLSECHFWTCRDDKIRIKDFDLGATRYYTNIKRDFDGKDLIALGKKEYIEQRDGIVILTNDKTIRLKDNIKKFEELIKNHRVIKTEWKNGCVVQMLLDNGMIIHICVNNLTGDILRIAFDKFFIGKLASDEITDAIFSRQNILLAYNTNQVTVVHLQKPTMKRSSPEKISNMDPKIYHVLIPGSPDKKLSRNLVVNRSFDLIIVWTKSSQNELFPWKPTYQDQDRANMHVFKLREDRLEAIGFCWTENEPLCTQFLRTDENKIITVEQKISRKGEISADICIYGIVKGRLQKTSSHAIPIGSQISSHRFSPDQERLFLGTVDHCVCIYDITRQKTKFLPKTEIAPKHSSWHSDSTVILIGNDEAKLQLFDYALNPISTQLMSEDIISSNILDISVYFMEKPKLISASFSFKVDRKINNINYSGQSDFFLLLIFEYGPIACLRFYGNTFKSDSGLSADALISKYLIYNQLDRAVNLLLCSNWESNSAMCMLALNKICNFVVTREDVKRSRNDMLKKALRSFTDQLSNDVKDEYGDQVIDLRRRFFFFLLRNKLFNESLEIARVVLDYDLFMDLFNCTKSDPNLISITHEAYHQAEQIVNQTEKDSKSSKTSEDSEKHNSDDDDTTTTSSIPSCAEYLDSLIFSSAPKDPYRRRSLSSGREITDAHKYTEHNSFENTCKDTLFGHNHIQQQLKVKRYHKNLNEMDFVIQNVKSYVPPLKSYKSTVNKAASVKINKPKQVEIPDSPNVSNGCFRLLKKPKESPSKCYSKSNSKDEVDVSSSMSIATNRSLKSSNYQLQDLVPNKNRKKASDLYINSSTKYRLPEQTIGIPLSLPKMPPPLNFQSSAINATHHFIPRASTTHSNNNCNNNVVEKLFHHRKSMSPDRLSICDLNINNVSETQQTLSTSPSKFTLNKSIGIPSLFNESSVGVDSCSYTQKYYQYPLVLGHIPSSTPLEFPSAINQSIVNNSNELTQKNKKASSILSANSTSSSVGLSHALITNNSRVDIKRDPFIEKNKVKFSDTVQVAVVPDLPRKEKPIPMKRNGFIFSSPSSKGNSYVMDPEKELAESLPLCNPREEYLKDFNPVLDRNNLTESGDLHSSFNENHILINRIANNNTDASTNISANSNILNYNSSDNNNDNPNSVNDNNNNNNGSTIKVVHFGIV